MDLHTITGDFNYSKYYLHRMFTAAAGIRCMNMQSDGD